MSNVPARISPRFELLRNLAHPKSQNDTWIANDLLANKRAVILKEISVPQSIRDSPRSLLKYCDSFLALAHPCLARPIDVCSSPDANKLWLVTEFIRGEPYLPNIHSLSREVFLDLVSQFCSVLHYLHVRGYVHLDLHPGNVLIASRSDSPNNQQLTLIDVAFFPLTVLQRNSHLISFNLNFSAPEVCNGEFFDHRSDLYSLGALLYHALLDIEDPTSISSGEYGNRMLCNPDLITPSFLAPIVNSLLDNRIDRRPSSAYFLLKDINAHLNSDKLSPTPISKTIVESVPWITTEASTSLLHSLDELVTSSLSTPDYTVHIIGLPGSGKERLARIAGLYLTLFGYYVLTPDHDGTQVFYADVILKPSECSCFSLTDAGQTLLDADFSSTPLLLFKLQHQLVRIHSTHSLYATPAGSAHASSSGCTIPLGPMSSSEFMELIDVCLPNNSLSLATKQSLFSRSLGLPGMLFPIVFDHIWESRIRIPGGFWESVESLDINADEFALPQDAIHVMRPVFSETRSSELLVLQLLSLTPFPLNCGDLVRILGLPSSVTEDAVNRLRATPFVALDATHVSIQPGTSVELVHSHTPPEVLRSFAASALSLLSDLVTPEPCFLDALLAAYARIVESSSRTLHHAIRAARYFESHSQYKNAVLQLKLALSVVSAPTSAQRLHVLQELLILLDKVGEQQEFSYYASLVRDLLPQQDTRHHLSLFILLANHHSRLSETKESMRFCVRALAIARRDKSLAAQTACLDLIARNRLRLGAPWAALATARRSVRLKARNSLKSTAHISITTMAGAYYMEGDYSRALKCARLAADKQHQDISPSTLNNLGILLMESGDLRRAERTFDRCLQIAHSESDLLTTGMAHGNLVLRSFYSGDLARMKVHVNAFLRSLGASGARYGYDHFLLSTAEALLLRGNVDDSLGSIAKAQAASAESGDAMNELLAKLQKAWVLYHVGAYEQAKASFIEIELPLDKAGYRVHQVSCGLGLSNVETALGEFQSARERLERIYARLPRQHIISDLVYRISKGRHHAAMNEYAQARRSFVAAEALARSHGFRPYVFEAQLSLAQCFLALGDSVEVAYYLKRLYGLNEKLRYRLLEPWLHLAFADHLASAGDFWEEKRHLLNARTSLLELAHNIGDLTLRQHFLNRPDARSLLQRSEDVEDLLYSHSSSIAYVPPVSSALESIARINEQLHRRDSMKSTLSLIVDEALRLSGAERGIIFLFDPSGREELKVARNLGRRSLADARRYTRTALLAIRRGDIVFAADTFTDPNFSGSESITHHRIRSVVCVPLRSRLSIIGALYLDSRKRGLNARPDLLKSLEIFSQQAAAALERAARYFHISEENRKLRESARLDRPKLIGQGTHFTHLKQLIGVAASSDLPVLILGESGTGKELIARAIHESGPRAKEPFLSVDCGALPDNLVESELFGYRKGAFTGAENHKEGLFVAARGGTLFLDEIANTSLLLQMKLLRAFQEREIRPLGSTESVPFKARIVAATNRDLRKESREGRFRQDLLFRLNGLSIETTPLRNRKSDIPLLIGHFLQEYRHRTGRKIWSMSDQALQALGRHDWPGNVRELQNCIERAVALARGDTIGLGDLPDAIRSTSVVAWDKKNGEHRLIEEALSLCAGDKTRAADYIGWNRPKLYRKMAHYNIPRDFGRRNTA